MAARFIWANMPYGQHGVLSSVMARNIADFVGYHHRPTPQHNIKAIFKR